MTHQPLQQETKKTSGAKKNVVLLFGGKSTEHEVSIRSAASVYRALNPNKYDVTTVGISKSGRWLSGPRVTEALLNNTPLSESVERIALLPDPTVNSFVSLMETGTPTNVSSTIDVVIPILHGRYGEDGALQGLLEMANVPYVGCGVIGSVLGMDKAKQKELFDYHGLPIVGFFVFYRSEWQKDSNDIISKIRSQFADTYPLFVKPANTGSSVGVGKARNLSQLTETIEDALRYDSKIIVEEGVNDIREIEISVLGNLFPKASVCGEIVPSNEFYDYAAKYIDDRSESVIPAELPTELSEKLRECAIHAFRVLECRGLSRVDFFVSKNSKEFWLNEINTLPGFTSISMYPKLWEATGLSFSDLVDQMIELALEEWQDKQRLETSQS